MATTLEEAAEAVARYAQECGDTHGVTAFVIVLRAGDEMMIASSEADARDELAAALRTLVADWMPSADCCVCAGVADHAADCPWRAAHAALDGAAAEGDDGA